MLQINGEQKMPSQVDLIQTVNRLNSIKSDLQKIKADAFLEKIESSSTNKSVSSSKSFNSRSMTSNETVRNSIEMLKNGGKFTQPLGKMYPKLSSAFSKAKSSKKNIQKNNSKHNIQKNVSPTWSITSLKSLITVSSCAFSRRKSPLTGVRTAAKKISRQKLLRKSDKKTKDSSDGKQKYDAENEIEIHSKSIHEKQEPNVISTHYSMCRIHSYEDKSFTFEIMKPRHESEYEDFDDASEIVIVVLPNGQTAIFTTKLCNSFMNLSAFGE